MKTRAGARTRPTAISSRSTGPRMPRRCTLCVAFSKKPVSEHGSSGSRWRPCTEWYSRGQVSRLASACSQATNPVRARSSPSGKRNAKLHGRRVRVPLGNAGTAVRTSMGISTSAGTARVRKRISLAVDPVGRTLRHGHRFLLPNAATGCVRRGRATWRSSPASARHARACRRPSNRTGSSSWSCSRPPPSCSRSRCRPQSS